MEWLVQEANFHTDIKPEHTQGRITPITNKMHIRGPIKIYHHAHSRVFSIPSKNLQSVLLLQVVTSSKVSLILLHISKDRVRDYFRQEEATIFKKKK